ncbi:hypothetical protein A9G24_04780 [Gilliamella sp. App6-5]|uniref:HEPN domain-containing protein n=1 Tax=Gilliamella sp. App6-5 TaxID=3120232 RepID=UPI00080E503D|nr:HEPN domain-containing protein [Gilliamella apicola]OCG16315.1 hypothetical protein A9G24_04780 [Gilliamella apicola]
MSVNCKDFLSFAEDSLKRNDEIGYRNAIARAYYSCYHAILSSINFRLPKDEPSHKSVTDYLAAPGKDEAIPRMKLISLRARLLEQKALRIKCDYHLQETLDKKEAELSIAKARKFIQDIEEFIPLSNDSAPNS